MALVQNTNVAALLAQRRLEVSNNRLQSSLEKLSSGFRINRAADDAAGLTISQNLTSQIRRMQQAQRNTQDGVSVLQVAEGALSVIGENLQRVRELAVQGSNDTNSVESRQAIDNEVTALLEDINRIAGSTQFNGTPLLDGTLTNALLQVGPNSDPITNTVDITPALGAADAGTLGFAALPITGAAGLAFIGLVDTAIIQINTMRASVGSYQNKLESVASNLDLAVENFSASNSRIRDLDVAAESSNMIQSQILQQAATMVLAQTNQLPQQILSLLQP